MVMSHAAAIWIPSTGHNLGVLGDVFAKNAVGAGRGLVYDRKLPAVTCLVVPLDDNVDGQLDFDLLTEAAAAAAKTFKTRAYALYGFFGSADWLQVTAFSSTGKERWIEAAAEKPNAKKLRTIAGTLGLRVQGQRSTKANARSPVVTSITFPYWRMVAESKEPVSRDLLALGLKPAFDLASVKGWTFRQEVQAEGGDDDGIEEQKEPKPKSTGRVLTKLKIGDRVVDPFGFIFEVIEIEANEDDGKPEFRLAGIGAYSGAHSWVPESEVKDSGLRRLKE